MSVPLFQNKGRLAGVPTAGAGTSRRKEVLVLREYIMMVLVSVAANLISENLLRWLDENGPRQ